MNKTVLRSQYLLPFVVLIIVFLFFIFKNSAPIYGQNTSKGPTQESKVISNQLIVKFDAETAKSLQHSANSKDTKDRVLLTDSDISNTEAKDVIRSLSASTIQSLRKATNEDLNKEKLNEVDKWFVINLPDEKKEIALDSIEAKLLDQKAKQIKNLAGVEDVNLNGVVTVQMTPNDTYYSNQYAPALIDANDAWDITTGSSSVKVAILDSGIKTDQGDFNNIVSSMTTYDTGTDTDTCGHGTHVAGIVGATINNSTGVAGLASGASLINVKVIGPDGCNGNNTNIISGINYAADNGATIINMSLGGPTTCPSSIQDAINYAYTTKGVTIIAAAGNESSTSLTYPASCNNVLSVANTNSSDQLYTGGGGSNYGTSVDIAAPGTAIYSTHNGYDGQGSYTYMTGTSMASPQVAGVAALVKSYNSGFTNGQVVNAILSNADPISGTGTYWSNGRLNARKAVVGKPSAPTLSIASNGCGNGTPEVALSWDPVPGNASDVIGYKIYRKLSPHTSYDYLGLIYGVPNVGFVDSSAFGIVPNTSASYKVSAVSGVTGDSADSNAVNLTTQNCSGSGQLPAPTDLNVTANYCSSGNPIVTLGWSSISGASSYLVYRKYDFQSQYYYLGATNSTTFNDYTGTGIVEGGNAYYRVMSNNGGGQSGYSNTYFATSQNCP